MEKTLTLSQTVETALQNNQDLLSAQEGIRVAELRVREAESQYYPKAGLNFAGSRYLAEQDYVLPEFGSLLLRPSRNLRPDTFYSARAWLNQPLYNGGRTRATVRLAKTNLEQARVRHEQIRDQVVLDATKSFYDLLLVRRQIAEGEAAARRVESFAAQSAEGGRSPELQALQGRLRRALAAKRREEEKAYIALLGNLGIELYTRVGLDGELETRAARFDLAKLLAWAQESRLEIRNTEYQRQIDQLAVNLSQAERNPVVAFGAGYELNDPAFPLQSTQWNATLNVSLPIFDGFANRSRIRQRKAQARQSRIQRAALEDQINKEVREAYADLAYWQEEILQRKQELDRLSDAAERSGRGPLDRAAAQEWVLESRQTYWEAVQGHRVALAKLEKAVGRSLAE